MHSPTPTAAAGTGPSLNNPTEPAPPSATTAGDWDDLRPDSSGAEATPHQQQSAAEQSVPEAVSVVEHAAGRAGAPVPEAALQPQHQPEVPTRHPVSDAEPLDETQPQPASVKVVNPSIAAAQPPASADAPSGTHSGGPAEGANHALQPAQPVSTATVSTSAAGQLQLPPPTAAPTHVFPAQHHTGGAGEATLLPGLPHPPPVTLPVGMHDRQADLIAISVSPA